LAQTAPRAPRFLLRRRCSVFNFNRLVANGLSPFALVEAAAGGQVVKVVIWSFGQNRFWTDRKRHYNNKYIYIYYYSEHKRISKMKMTKMTLTTLTTPDDLPFGCCEIC